MNQGLRTEWLSCMGLHESAYIVRHDDIILPDTGFDRSVAIIVYKMAKNQQLRKCMETYD